jgi:hypothetical protein
VDRIRFLLYGRERTRRNPGCAKLVFEAILGAAVALFLMYLSWPVGLAPVYSALRAAIVVPPFQEGNVKGPLLECCLGPAVAGALAGMLLGTIASILGRWMGSDRGEIVGAAVGSIIGGALVPIAVLAFLWLFLWLFLG